jgi:hypothetical protein
MQQDIHKKKKKSAPKLDVFVHSGPVPILLRLTTCFFASCLWVPLSDLEPQAALKYDLIQYAIFHILLFFGLAVYRKHYINPVYPGMSSERKHIT